MLVTVPVLFLLLWASGYVVGAIGVGTAEPLGLLAVRFVLATVVIVPLALRVPGWRRMPLRRLAVVGLLLQALQFAGVYGGLALGVPAALAALVVLGLTPLTTLAMTTATGLERPDPRAWVGLLVGLAGVGVSLAPELEGAAIGGGVALTVLGMLGLAGGTVLQKHWVGPADVRVSLAMQSVASTVVLVPLAAATGQLTFTPSVDLVWTVVYLAWVLTLGATGLFVQMLRRFQASTVTTLLLVVPAVTALMSAVVLGERLHVASLVGMAITILGVGSVLRLQRPTPAVETAQRPVRRAFAAR